MLNGQLREIYAAAGVEKRPNAPDRDLLCRWAGEMGMTQELIVQAAEYARGARSKRLAGRLFAACVSLRNLQRYRICRGTDS